MLIIFDLERTPNNALEKVYGLEDKMEGKQYELNEAFEKDEELKEEVEDKEEEWQGRYERMQRRQSARDES